MIMDWAEWNKIFIKMIWEQFVVIRVHEFAYWKAICYRIDAWAIRRPWLTFVNALANSILGRFYTARTQRFTSWVWPMVLRKLGNRWKWKGEAWFHYTKVLFVGVVGIAEMWFYLAVRKITASRENRREPLGDEVMKTASHRHCTLQVTLIEFEQLLQGRKWELVFTFQSHFVDFSHDH